MRKRAQVHTKHRGNRFGEHRPQSALATRSLLMFANYYVTGKILNAVTPAFGRLAAVEARLEGEYRAGMARVGREAEEVA